MPVSTSIISGKREEGKEAPGGLTGRHRDPKLYTGIRFSDLQGGTRMSRPGKHRPGSVPVLEIRDLTVKVGRKRVLSRLSLSIGPGEVHVLLGPNGGGKTTLLMSIMGMPGTPGFDAAHLMLEAAMSRYGTIETIAAALGNVAAAAFLLWAFQRAFLAPRSPDSPASVAPASVMERAIAGVLILVLLGAGFYSEPWLKLVDAPLAELSTRFPHG